MSMASDQMMSRKGWPGICSAAFIILLASSALLADVVPGRWEMVDGLDQGTAIVVILRAGDRIHCTFERSDEAELVLVTDSGRKRRVQKSAVSRVETFDGHPDSVLNGTLIGFGAGAGGFLAVHAAIVPLAAHDGPAALAIGGIGALVGLLIDNAVKKREVLYAEK